MSENNTGIEIVRATVRKLIQLSFAQIADVIEENF